VGKQTGTRVTGRTEQTTTAALRHLVAETGTSHFMVMPILPLLQIYYFPLKNTDNMEIVVYIVYYTY